MQAFLFLSRFDFFLKSNFSIITGPKLLFRLVIFNLPKYLCADHDSFGGNNLLHSPLEYLADRDEIDDSGSIEPAVFRSGGGNPHKHANYNKHEDDDSEVESKTSHHHFKGNCAFGSFVKRLRKFLHSVYLLLVYDDLGQAVDGFAEEVDHEVPRLEEKLLAGNVGWPGIDEEAECKGQNNGCGYDKDEIDLGNISNSYNEAYNSFKRISEGIEKIVVDSSKIIRQFIDQNTRRGRIKEATGAADQGNNHSLMCSAT